MSIQPFGDGADGVFYDTDTGLPTTQPPAASAPAPAVTQGPPPTIPAGDGAAPAAPAGAPAVPAAAVPTPSTSATPPDLRAIAQIESAGGKNKNHRKIMGGPLKGETAGGAFALTPSTARQGIKQHPTLMKLYGNVASAPNDDVTTFLNTHPDDDEAIARVIWNDHLTATNGNPHQAAIMWYGGPDDLEVWKRWQKGDDTLTPKQVELAKNLDQYGKDFDSRFESAQAGKLEPIVKAPGPVLASAPMAHGHDAAPMQGVPPLPVPHGHGSAPMQGVPGEDPSLTSTGDGMTTVPSPDLIDKVQEANRIGGNAAVDRRLGPQPAPQPVTDASVSAGGPRQPVSAPVIATDQQPATPAAADPGDDLEKQLDDIRQRIIGEANETSKWSAAQQAKIDQVTQDVASGKIDPNHLWASMGTGHRILAAIGLALGTFGASVTHSPNEAAAMIHDAIDRDVASQQANLGRKASLLGDMMKEFGDVRQARTATIAALNDVARSMVSELRFEKFGILNPGTRNQLSALNAGLMEIERRRGVLAKAYPGIAGSIVNKVVPWATDTSIAHDTKQAFDVALADSMRTGRFSPEMIDKVIGTMSPDVGRTPATTKAMLDSIEFHLKKKRDELLHGGMMMPDDGTGAAAADMPSGYSSVSGGSTEDEGD
jgi:hypothetical protein